jgi:GGDEF domain-containing protein
MRHNAADDARALGSRIAAAMTRPIALPSGHLVAVGMSVGEASYSSIANTPEALMEQADKALYAAKKRTPSRSARVV